MKFTCNANLKKAVMKHGFSGLSQGDKITIRLELSIEGSDSASGNYPINFGFSHPILLDGQILIQTLFF